MDENDDDGLLDVPEANGNLRYERVALRPPEGSIDLDAAVPGEGDLEVDIGFGRGASLFSRAAAAPERRIVGIELKAKWAYKVEKRRRALGLSNVLAWAADARDLLRRAGPDGSVQRVFVHFPDPWWKKRHAKRRVLGPELLDDLARLLVPGGQLFVQTDVLDRAELYADVIDAHPLFERQMTPTGWLEGNPFGSVSNRESRAELDGLPVFRTLAIRCESESAQAVEERQGADGHE